MTVSRPRMPAARVTARGITSSASPNAIERYPRPFATLLYEDCERPRRAVLGTGLCMVGSVHSRLQHHFDASVLLVSERLVHLRAALERFGVGDDKGGIDLVLHDPLEEIIGPTIDMGLAGSD